MTLIKQGGPIPAQTFRRSMPLATHWRAASCEEFGCSAFRLGWKTVIPKDSDLIAVLKGSGRKYTSERVQGDLVEFAFEAGQPCFRASTHRIQTDRPAIYLHGPREYARDHRNVRPDEWQERFVETMDELSLEQAEE